jgi:hypothetical protein
MNICATAKPESVFAFVHAGCWIAPFRRDRVSEVCQGSGILLAFAAFPDSRSKNSPTGKSLNLSSPPAKNISLSPSGKSALPARAIPPHRRGVCAIVTKREAGCGGRDGAQDERANAYGEVVWS